jgi:hypothetical protein
LFLFLPLHQKGIAKALISIIAAQTDNAAARGSGGAIGNGPGQFTAVNPSAVCPFPADENVNIIVKYFW